MINKTYSGIMGEAEILESHYRIYDQVQVIDMDHLIGPITKNSSIRTLLNNDIKISELLKILIERNQFSTVLTDVTDVQDKILPKIFSAIYTSNENYLIEAFQSYEGVGATYELVQYVYHMPSSPVEGIKYLISINATGAWEPLNFKGRIANIIPGTATWEYNLPSPNMRIKVSEDSDSHKGQYGICTTLPESVDEMSPALWTFYESFDKELIPNRMFFLYNENDTDINDNDETYFTNKNYDLFMLGDFDFLSRSKLVSLKNSFAKLETSFSQIGPEFDNGSLKFLISNESQYEKIVYLLITDSFHDFVLLQGHKDIKIVINVIDKSYKHISFDFEIKRFEERHKFYCKIDYEEGKAYIKSYPWQTIRYLENPETKSADISTCATELLKEDGLTPQELIYYYLMGSENGTLVSLFEDVNTFVAYALKLEEMKYLKVVNSVLLPNADHTSTNVYFSAYLVLTDDNKIVVRYSGYPDNFDPYTNRDSLERTLIRFNWDNVNERYTYDFMLEEKVKLTTSLKITKGWYIGDDPEKGGAPDKKNIGDKYYEISTGKFYQWTGFCWRED